MYLPATFGGHSSYRNGDISCYINSYMDILKKAEIITSIRHIARFLKSGILIYNPEILDTTGRKTKRGSRRKTSYCKALCVSRKSKKCSIIGKRISKYQRKRLITGLNQIKTTHACYSEAFLSVKHAAVFSRNANLKVLGEIR